MKAWISSIFLFLCIFLVLPWDIPTLSRDLNDLCLNQLSFRGSLKDIYKAFVCGKRLPSGHLKELFVQGGLIHLTVVSGAHLLFLEKFWKKLPLPSIVKTPGVFVVLILYALASQLHPPVVRALVAFFLFRVSHFFKLFWSPQLLVLLSGILCLIYRPSWVYFFSLQLSLLACLLQTISTSSIKKCFFTYLFIFPIVNRWQVLHPLTVLINWILAPLISCLLFPLTFISPFVPSLYPLTDTLWSIVLQALKWVQVFLSPTQSHLLSWIIPEKWIWPYIAMVCCILFINSCYQRRLLYSSKKKKSF